MYYFHELIIFKEKKLKSLDATITLNKTICIEQKQFSEKIYTYIHTYIHTYNNKHPAYFIIERLWSISIRQ